MAGFQCSFFIIIAVDFTAAVGHSSGPVHKTSIKGEENLHEFCSENDILLTH
jgi:hypothetical protein